MGDNRHAEYVMIHHFDQLLRDCKDPFEMERRSLEYWTKFGHVRRDPRIIQYLTLAFITILLIAIGAFGYLPVEYLAALIVIAFVAQALAVQMESGEIEVGIYRTGPGWIRKYHVATADAVERTHRVLNQGRVPFKMYGVALTNWPDRPRASIFVAERSGLRVSVFKDLDDPYFTVVHIGGVDRRNRRAASTVMRLLDRHVPEDE